MVELYRDDLSPRAPLVGRILAQSKWVFVMEKVDPLYQTDGFVAARISDISRIKSGGRELDMAATVARFRDEPLTIPDVALLEISSALSFFNKTFGHASVYVERLDPGVCFIGQEVELDDDFVRLRQYGTMKSMDRSELLLRYADITRVDAGGSYESQLVGRYLQGG
ncbi:Hypothetical protein A7982_06733 [Minicystis rosea]|nr:Hypothetical protein A7982_06733 [Minicystis rosea]